MKTLFEKSMFGFGDIDVSSPEGIQRSIGNLMNKINPQQEAEPITYIVKRAESMRYPGSKIQSFRNGADYIAVIDIPKVEANYAVKISEANPTPEIIDDIETLGQDIGENIRFEDIPENLRRIIIDDLNQSRW